MFFRWMVFPYFSFMPFSKRVCCTCLYKHQLVPNNVFWSFKRHSFKIPSPKKSHDFLHPFILRRLWRLQPKQCQQPRLPSPCPLARKSPLKPVVCFVCVCTKTPWILPRRLLEVKRFTAEDPKMWVKKVFMRKLRINYRSFFGVLNKISLHISPKKNDNDMKEWAKWGKDEISYQILSHRERVVGHDALYSTNIWDLKHVYFQPYLCRWSNLATYFNWAQPPPSTLTVSIPWHLAGWNPSAEKPTGASADFVRISR